MNYDQDKDSKRAGTICCQNFSPVARRTICSRHYYGARPEIEHWLNWAGLGWAVVAMFIVFMNLVINVSGGRACYYRHWADVGNAG